MSHFTRCLISITVLITVASSVPATVIHKHPARPQRSVLDDDSTTALTLQHLGNSLYLSWRSDFTKPYWAVLRDEKSAMDSPDTLAVTADTFWVDEESTEETALFFYQVLPYLLNPPPDTGVVIEDFESGPYTMGSIPDEDFDPNDWEVTTSDAYGGTAHSLRMYGNTWKTLAIDPRPVEYGTVWEVALKLDRLGEIHAIGVADTGSHMRYPIWGTQSPQADNWLTVYEGWFEEDEWITVLLPIGEDWHGRFGYLPTITELHFVNDNDNSNGEVFIDEIRDVTDMLPYPPVVDFQWSFAGGAPPGSVRVQFHSLSYDPDSPIITHLWEFGDGARSTLEHPYHDYLEHGLYTVTLTVEDEDDNVTWQSQSVEDPPVSMTREFRGGFVGDIILARGYESTIIPEYGVESIFEPTVHLFETVDLMSINLECQLTTSSTRHPTKGITFKGRPEYVAGLVYAGVDFATLANNHIIDYMEAGMLETQVVLDTSGIIHTGAGMNDLQARKAKFMSRNGLSVAMLGFCNRHGSYLNDQPFLDAGRSRPGFALWHNSSIEATIPEADSLADFVVVNVHSGDEYVNEPDKSGGPSAMGIDPEYEIMSEVADADELAMRRYALEQGADLLINHHPHVIQGFEVYQGKLIAHSMGNYAFDLNYAECNPTVVLHARFTADNGIDEAIVHPVYIDHWIPTPATGLLGQAILDYESRLSRAFDTWLVRNPGEDTARIIWDTTAVVRTGTDWVDTLALQEFGGWWVSRAIPIPEAGYPVSVDLPGVTGAEVRMGRDKFWFGGMEDDGATPWNLNSSHEEYNTDESHSGLRSIRLRRAHDAGDNVVTLLNQRFYIDADSAYSLIGWIKTQNAGDAVIESRCYSSRSGSLLQSQDVEGPLTGDNDWTYREQQINVPPSTTFYNVRVSLYPPGSDTGYAWFDDIALIQWESWQAAPAAPPFPSDLTFFQIRIPAEEDSVVVNYRTEWIP